MEVFDSILKNGSLTIPELKKALVETANVTPEAATELMRRGLNRGYLRLSRTFDLELNK